MGTAGQPVFRAGTGRSLPAGRHRRPRGANPWGDDRRPATNEWDEVSESRPAAPRARARAEQLLGEGHPAKEVARRLGVSVTTVYRWRRSTGPASDLAQARARVGELEREVLLCRQVIATMRQMMPPKDVTR